MLRLGYACINTYLREQGVYSTRDIRVGSIEEKGIGAVRELAIKNLHDLKKIIQWNEEHGIRFFRITSGLFPHCDNLRILDLYDYDINFAKDQLKDIGDMVKKLGHRITMHPGQYVQLGSENEIVIMSSLLSLTHGANIFVAMGLSEKDGSGLIIHGGGVYGNRNAARNRFQKNFRKLPEYVQRLVVLENDEWSWSVNDLLPLAEKLDVPFCLDIFHNSISKDKVKITKVLMTRIFRTWKYFAPKLHLSEQEPGMKLGSHSMTINKIPRWVFILPKLCKCDVYIMLEVKDKEVSVLKMLDKYFRLVNKNDRIQWYPKKLINK